MCVPTQDDCSELYRCAGAALEVTRDLRTDMPSGTRMWLNCRTPGSTNARGEVRALGRRVHQPPIRTNLSVGGWCCCFPHRSLIDLRRSAECGV